MLRRIFDPQKRYKVVLYLRMSSDSQNPTSPEQQQATIETTIRRLNLPWDIVKIYVDRAVSGRYYGRREQFQEMLCDIRTGKVKADLILVDTFERFGRSEEAGLIRQELQRQYGCLIVTADTSFADPTSISGQALAAFENLRATDDNRIKAHNVLRGKRQAVKDKHWPGGPVPFGYKLETILIERNGRTEVDYSILVIDPETGWIITLLFSRAHETGEGCTTLTQWLNANPEIPDKYKPFNEHTINEWLKSELYKGVMVWEEHSTGVIDDRRVIEKNPESIVLRVPGFCPPLVAEDIWDSVAEVRRARSRKRGQNRAAKDGDEKLIAPLVVGVSLKYMLSGLVVCGHCDLAMIPNGSSEYTLKSTGETRRYVSYMCARSASGACNNKTRVPEDWLRDTVIMLLKSRLFPAD
jgi:site-specific DNA recombinase